MKVKSRSIYLKNGKEVVKHHPATNRRFLTRIQTYLAERMCIIVRYRDDKGEYEKGGQLLNDSGWYSGKKKVELLKTARAFLKEGR